MKAKLVSGRLFAILMFTVLSACLFAQEETVSPVSVGADLYSRYIWRGTDFGNSPAVQPDINFSRGGFAVGAWGSYPLSGSSYLEADLYTSFSFEFGLSAMVTDYYFPAAANGKVTDSGYFDIRAHTFEIGLNQNIGNFYLSGYYLLNANGDIYLEAGYSYTNFSLFLGAGNKVYSPGATGDFSVVSIGISAFREIKITDNFSLPVSGSFIVNPDLKQAHIVFGISL
jgi:hypothetical protein